MVSFPTETKAKALKRKSMFKKAGLVNIKIRKASPADRKIGFKFVVRAKKKK